MLTRSEPCSITFDSLHRPSRAYLPPALHGGSCLVFDAVIDATGSGLRPGPPSGRAHTANIHLRLRHHSLPATVRNECGGCAYISHRPGTRARLLPESAVVPR